jgi:hypothetical protein
LAPVLLADIAAWHQEDFRQKRLTTRDAALCEPSEACILGIIATLPPFAKLLPSLEVNDLVEILKTTKRLAPTYVYVAPDPGKVLTIDAAMSWLEPLLQGPGR